MTYVTEQTSAELATHMRMLQATPGWHEPLADRLWAEVQALQTEVQRITEARRLEWSNAQQERADNADLLTDAARYRWLRERDSQQGITILSVGEWTAGATCIALTFHSAEEVDITVDAEMAKEAAQ